MTASTLDPVRTEPAPAGDRPPSPGRGRWSAFWRHPAARWSAALLLVIVIIATTITAFAAVTYCVAVDLVCDPSGAVCVRVSGGIDGSSFAGRANPRLCAGVGVRSSSGLTGGITDTV